MIKPSELLFTAIKIPIDLILLIGAGLSAYYLRFDESITKIRPVVFQITFWEIFFASLIVGAICLIFFALAGLYKFRRLKITDEIGKIILGCTAGLSVIIIYMFFVRDLFDSRFIVLTGWVLSIFYILIGRMILRKIQLLTLKHGFGTNRVVIIGDDSATKEIIDTIKNNLEFGYQIIKRFSAINIETLESIKEFHRKKPLDEILQTDSSISRHDSITLLDFAEENNIQFKYAAGTFEARATNTEVHLIAGVPLIEIRKTKLDGWGKIIKRLVDIVFSFFLIIVFSPIMILSALAIKLESRGPVIYKNKRVARSGEFNVYKFRSMYSHFCVGEQFSKYTDQKKILEYEQSLIAKQSERQGPVYKILNDPRRTKVGRFLEKTSLDELPQLFNVFIGNMSLVGPRPHQAREVEKYEKHHKRVLDIKPGVTGLAQISGRSDLNFDEEVKLDTYYIENWSLKLDLWILLKTPFVVLTRKSRV